MTYGLARQEWVNDEGPIWIYEEPDADDDYVIGADTAEGKIRDRASGPIEYSSRDPDFNYASVCRVSDGVEVATYMSNFAPGTFVEDLIFLGRFYGRDSGCEQDAFVVPEINGPGFAVCEGLRERGYPRIWITRAWNHIEQSHLETVGWRTTMQTRPLMVRDLQIEVADGTTGVRCIRTALHMAAMAKSKQGKDEAPPGAHDDGAFARMLAIQGRKALLPGAKKIQADELDDAPPRRSRKEKERDWADAHLESLDHDEEDELDHDLRW